MEKFLLGILLGLSFSLVVAAAEPGALAPGRNQRQIERIAAAPLKYPLRFIFTADTAFDPKMPTQREVLFRAIAGLKEPPDFVMVAGDFCGPGTEPRHREHIVEAERLLALPNLTALGNHDLDVGLQEGLERFRTIHGPENYAFSLGNTGFAVIASAQGAHGLLPGALEWLDRALAADAQPVKVVLMHIPPSMEGHFAPRAEWSFRPDAQFFDVLRRRRVSLLCCGHWLGFDFHVRDGLPIVTSAGAFMYFRPKLVPHQPPRRSAYPHFIEISIAQTGAIGLRMAHEKNGWQFDSQFEQTLPPRQADSLH